MRPTHPVFFRQNRVGPRVEFCQLGLAEYAPHLRTPGEIAALFEPCLEQADGDAAFIAKALGDIASAMGMAQDARDAGLSRESLDKGLCGERNPDFDTLLGVPGALGLKLRAAVRQT